MLRRRYQSLTLLVSPRFSRTPPVSLPFRLRQKMFHTTPTLPISFTPPVEQQYKMSDTLAHKPAWQRVKEGVINFVVGQPEKDLLPLELLEKATEDRFAKCATGAFDTRLMLQYGEGLGDKALRSSLSAFLTNHYNGQVNPDHLMISNGSSHALDLCCSTFAKEGDVVLVEDPTYFLSIKTFIDHRLNIVCVDTDENGLTIESLKRQLILHKSIAFLYCIPTHSNPSSTTLPLSRRRELAQLSEQHGFLIVADDVYQCLNYTSEVPPSPLPHLTKNALSLGSFTKILAPGLRLGWIEAHPEILDRLLCRGVISSGGGLNPFAGSIVQSAIDMGLLDQHLQKLKEVYAENMAALCEALKKELPNCSFQPPKGGYFVWLRLPEGVDGEELFKKSEEFGVSFSPGIKSSAQKRMNNYIRLCFAFYPREQLVEGTKRLSRLLDWYQNEKKTKQQ